MRCDFTYRTWSDEGVSNEAARHMEDLTNALQQRDNALQEYARVAALAETTHLEEVAALRLANEEHGKQLTSMNQRIQDEGDALRAEMLELQGQHDTNLADVNARHAAQLEELKEYYDKTLGELDVNQKSVAEARAKHVSLSYDMP
jgi:hypothetical protein